MKTILVLLFLTGISIQGQTEYGYSTNSNCLVVEELVQKNIYNPAIIDTGKIIVHASNSNSFQRWQLKMGFSANNQEEYSIAVGYKLPVFKRNLALFEANFFTLPALSVLFGYKDVKITNTVYFEPMIGIVYIPFVLATGAPALCSSITLKYKITQHTNFIAEFRQVHIGLTQGGIFSFSRKRQIYNFPIRFISIGIEL